MIAPDNGFVVHDPDGAIHARFASQPWGPWSWPVQVLKAGNPNTNPPVAGSQYAANGILFHPGCTGACVPSDPASALSTVGRLYAATMIDAWTMNRADGTVDIYWNVPTKSVRRDVDEDADPAVRPWHVRCFNVAASV